jgi:hypothetical protein
VENITYNHSQSSTIDDVLFAVTIQYEITISLLFQISLLQLYQCVHTNYLALVTVTTRNEISLITLIFKYATVTVLSVCTYKLHCNVVTPTVLVSSV